MSDIQVHPTAQIHPNAKLGKGTHVGAFSMIGPDIETGPNCNIQENVILRGHVKIGEGANIFPFAVIGGAPQHLKYKGEPTRVLMGDRVTIREAATVNLGTTFGNEQTVIGDDVFLMAYAHVAHDCVIGKSVIVANAVQLAGHVILEDYVQVGGLSAIAQHCRVGRYSYIGGGSILRQDVLPFCLGKGTDPFKIQGINVIGLKRKNFSEETIAGIKRIFKIFYRQGLTTTQAMEKIVQEVGETDETKIFSDFINQSRVGFIR